MQNIQQTSPESTLSRFNNYTHRPTLDSLQRKLGVGTAAAAQRFAVGFVEKLPASLIRQWAQRRLSESEWEFLALDLLEAPQEEEQLPEEEEQLPEEDAPTEDIPAELDAEVEERPSNSDDLEAGDPFLAVELAPLAEEQLPAWAVAPYRKAKLTRPQLGRGPITARVLAAFSLVASFFQSPAAAGRWLGLPADIEHSADLASSLELTGLALLAGRLNPTVQRE